MAWLAVDRDGSEYIYEMKPIKRDSFYDSRKKCTFGELSSCVRLPSGSIAKLLGGTLSWEDDPVELK